MTTIGVFDSGVGGLSVLRALLADIPEAAFVYCADQAYAPYGERTPAQVAQRAQSITDYLIEHHAIDALVVACNTATAIAIDALRLAYPELPIVGVEPALKTAAALSRTGHVGVLATRGTLQSQRFALLLHRVRAAAAPGLRFVCQACDGLAHAIEQNDAAQTQRLCLRYLQALRAQTTATGPALDTLVLGCTHYPFAADILQELSGGNVRLVETGQPVAQRTRSVLALGSTPAPHHAQARPHLILLSTASAAPLHAAAQRWLPKDVDTTALSVPIPPSL